MVTWQSPNQWLAIHYTLESIAADDRILRGTNMTVVADRKYTPDELLRMPNAVAYELVDGRLLERNVSETSSRVAARIAYLLAAHVERTKDVIVYGADLGHQCFPTAPAQIR